MVRFIREAGAHVAPREALLDRCFGPERHAKTCELLRRGLRPAEGLAFAAVDAGGLVGTLRLWHIGAGSAGSALLLGPLGVAPERRCEGIGARLMRHGLAETEALGHRAVLLVGDAPYYARFGFSHRLTGGLVMPGPVDRARFLGRELVPGALAGARGPVVALGLPAILPVAAADAPLSIAPAVEHVPQLAPWPEVPAVAA